MSTPWATAGVAVEVNGYGNNSANINVFCFHTDETLSSAIEYECYDNRQTNWYELSSLTTYTNPVLAGYAGTATAGATAGTELESMVCLKDTSNDDAAAQTSDWMISSATGATLDTGSNPVQVNLMRGRESFVTQGTTNGILTQTTNPRATFNMVVNVPASTTTAAEMGFDLLVRYTYVGTTAPSPTFQGYTAVDDLGTEPPWIVLTAGTHGIKHAKASATSPYYANIPATNQEATASAWLVDA